MLVALCKPWRPGRTLVQVDQPHIARTRELGDNVDSGSGIAGDDTKSAPLEGDYGVRPRGPIFLQSSVYGRDRKTVRPATLPCSLRPDFTSQDSLLFPPPKSGDAMMSFERLNGGRRFY